MTVETSQTPSAAILFGSWPAVAQVPRGPLAAASAAIANRPASAHGPLLCRCDCGWYLRRNGNEVPPIAHPACFIHPRPDALARRIGATAIGFEGGVLHGRRMVVEGLTRALTVLPGCPVDWYYVLAALAAADHADFDLVGQTTAEIRPGAI